MTMPGIPGMPLLAGEPITNEMGRPPQCDRDKLICPQADWYRSEIERLRAALDAGICLINILRENTDISGQPSRELEEAEEAFDRALEPLRSSEQKDRAT